MSEVVLRLERFSIDIEKVEKGRRNSDYRQQPVLAGPIQTHGNLSPHITLVAPTIQTVPLTTALETFVNETLSADIRRCDRKHRQMRILAATIKVCSDMGIVKANIAEIAKRARVSTASLYQDFATREKLFEEAIIFATPHVFSELVVSVAETRPRERLYALLFRQCAVINHPHTRWLYSTYVCGEFSQISATRHFGKVAHKNIADFWKLELQTLHDQGVLEISKIEMAVNFVLGAVYRHSIVVTSFFGCDNATEPDLKTDATIAIQWLFDQFGGHE